MFGYKNYTRRFRLCIYAIIIGRVCIFHFLVNVKEAKTQYNYSQNNASNHPRIYIFIGWENSAIITIIFRTIAAFVHYGCR